MTTELRVAIYARVSTNDKKQDNENQLLQLREFASQNRWTLTHEYVDHVSGKRSDRKQFQEMFTDASKRKFDILLFWALDRFSREGTVATLNQLKQLDEYGVLWRSYQERWVDTTGGFKDAIIGFLAAMAKHERVRLSDRVKAGMERVKRNGSRSGLPIGRPKMEDDTKRAAEIRKFQKLHEDGASVRAIANTLGISTTTVQKLKRLQSEGAL